jgi:MtN3 and saliva related transmembrane protein
MILRFARDGPMTSGAQMRALGAAPVQKIPARHRSRFHSCHSEASIRSERFEGRPRTAALSRPGKFPDKEWEMAISAMSSGLVGAIGAAGAVLTTLCWVPQAIKIIRERDTRAISLPGTSLCVLGVLLWLVYGLAIVDAPLIGSSIVTFAMTSIILVLKIRHG